MRVPKPGVALFVLGMLWVGALAVFGPGEPDADAHADAPSSPPAVPLAALPVPIRTTPSRARESRGRPIETSNVVEPASERPQSVDATRAATLVTGLRSSVSRVEMFPMYRDNAEAAANQAHGYLAGFIDTITTVAPDLADEVADEIEQVLCESNASDGQVLLLLRLASDQSSFATEKGLGCVLANRLGPEPREDLVLWTALDAWRAARLPETPDMVRLGKQTQDERTQRALAMLRGDVADRRELR